MVFLLLASMAKHPTRSCESFCQTLATTCYPSITFHVIYSRVKLQSHVRICLRFLVKNKRELVSKSAVSIPPRPSSGMTFRILNLLTLTQHLLRLRIQSPRLRTRMHSRMCRMPPFLWCLPAAILAPRTRLMTHLWLTIRGRRETVLVTRLPL